MLIFLLINSVVILSAFFVVYRLLRLGDPLDSLISWFLVYFSQIIFTSFLLGIFGLLYLKYLVSFNLLILIIVYLLTKEKESGFNIAGLKTSALALLANKTVLFSASIILGFALVKISINLINPPFGWDCLNYHFVFPVEWLKHGNLVNPITISDDPSPPYYPINGSLFFFWLMLPLKNVFMADLGQAPFFVLAFFSLYSICKKIGLDRELSFYAAGLFIITPNVFKQLEIAYVDVMVAALFFCALNFLLALRRDFSFKNLLLWSVSFGLFLGTKTSAVVFGLALVLFFLWEVSKNLRKATFKKVAVYLAVFFTVTAALGGFIYIRNYIQTGNPLYPAEIKIIGRPLFKGVMPFATYRNRWTAEEFNLEKLLFHEGMGLQFMLFAIPALIFSLFAPLLKSMKRAGFATFYLLSLPAILYLKFWLFMPQLWVRYLYPAFGINYVAALYASNTLNISRKALRFLILACFLASAFELAGHSELITALILSAALFFILPVLPRLSLSRKYAAVLLIIFLAALIFLNYNYDKYEFSRYLLRSPFPKEEKEAWVWLNNHSDSSNIAYVGRPDVLPLYGAHFKNDIHYISVNAIHPVKLHYFPNARYIWTKDFKTLHKNLEKAGNYRQFPDYNRWLDNLKSERIGYLLVYSLHQVKNKVFPIEDSWARENRKLFNLIFKNDTVHIYEFSK